VPSRRDSSGLATSPHPRAVVEVGDDVVERWPLPGLSDATSKLARGTVLIVGGTTQTPGAMFLAGVAALRAGAGRLQIATTRPTAVAVALAVPEARVIDLETAGAEIQPLAIDEIASDIAKADTVLVGTGALDPDNAAAVAKAVLNHMAPTARIVFDAGSLAVVHAERETVRELRDRAVLIPNVTEAGHLLDREPQEIESSPAVAMTQLVDNFETVVALRMATTYAAASTGPIYRDDCGHPALATSGSGDVFAGILTGLLTSGAPSLAATIRAVRCHGLSGHAAVRRLGAHAILARELLQEIPSTSAR
jgi:ADP-dependent NAD(P)H-hydrate dehydratase